MLLNSAANWPVDPLSNVTACVFNGLIYGYYYHWYEGDVWLFYVTFDPATHATTGPNYIIWNMDPQPIPSLAAAVSGGKIFIFTAVSDGLSVNNGLWSGDGQDYNGFDYTCTNGASPSLLDAVTYEPGGTDPESVMLVYNNTKTSPVALEASRFSFPPDWSQWSGSISSTQDFTLPWPSASPSWQPVAQGNLMLGTSGGFNGTPAGAKAPCLQFYASTALSDEKMNEGRWEYNVASKSWAFTDITVNPGGPFPVGTDNMVALPWFVTTDPGSGTMQMSHIVYYSNVGWRQTFEAPSDWMVPQNNDGTYGWQGTPTTTADAPVGSTLRGLWTLVGVVLGPPPFAMNDDTDACMGMTDPRAWVSYGQGTSATVTTTTTSSSKVTVGVGASIKAGVGGGFSGSLDISYAHAWTSSHSTSKTTSVSNTFTFSPCNEPVGSQGTHGWAIFNAPTLVTQWYKLYAYDYNPSSGSGTYLDEDVYATALGSSTQQIAYFDLADPSAGEYPGLFAGIPAYPNSTDVASWHLHAPHWDEGSSDWTVQFGDVTSPPVSPLSLGTKDEETYTKSTTTMTSKGNSNSCSVDATAGYTWPFVGFKAGVSLSAGYEGEWTTTTEHDTTVTDSVTMGLNVPIPPDTPGYVNSLTVQPFWLSAATTNAPWIPQSYKGNLPWCIAWSVPAYSTNTGAGEARAGMSGAPASASGSIRHGGENEKDTYKLSGAPMAWLEADGSETQLPMTASDFDPSKGAEVSLNGHLFPADGTKGKWARKGDIWKYRTKDGVRVDAFDLDLDFAGKVWSLNASSKTLDQEIKVADDSLRVQLHLQGKHSFSTWINHDVQTTWSHEEKKAAWAPRGVHEIKGDYDSRKGEGRLVVKGHLPKKEKHFGDVQIVVNGAPVRFPLMATENFLKKLDQGGTTTYKAEGLSFEIDFGAGKWKATIDGNQFKGDMAPKDGAMRVQVLVGGGVTSDQTFQVQKNTTELKFGG
jgi:hypothetical protein